MWARFFSGRVQNGFETQNGFTRSGFRGIPSLVPKFAFLVVEIGLRKTPNLRIFQKLRLCTKSWCIFFWLGSEGIGCFKHVFRGTFVRVNFFCIKWQFQYPKKTEDLQFDIFSIFFFTNSVGVFFLVGSRMHFRIKMGLLGIYLGVCQVLCRDQHFLRIFKKLGILQVFSFFFIFTVWSKSYQNLT